jgi:hypothetical protein
MVAADWKRAEKPARTQKMWERRTREGKDLKACIVEKVL